MRYWLLRAVPLLAVISGICTPLTLATPTLRSNRINPATRVVSQQQSGPEALSPSLIYKRSSPVVIPRARATRNGTFFQELPPNFLLRYHIFTVSFAERSPVSQYLHVVGKPLCSFFPRSNYQGYKANPCKQLHCAGLPHPGSRTSGTLPAWTAARRHVPDGYLMEKVISFSSGRLKLELLNASVGSGGIPREFIVVG